MSRLPTRVIVMDNDGTEVDRGRWLAASGHGITISSDTDPTGWVRDYRYPAYRSEFESAGAPARSGEPVPVAPAASPAGEPDRPANPTGGRRNKPRTPPPRETPAMQLDPDIAYALGGPFTPDQVAILTRADLTRPADHQERALELAQLPETERPAELGFPDSPEEDDHDACPYRAGT